MTLDQAPDGPLPEEQKPNIYKELAMSTQEQNELLDQSVEQGLVIDFDRTLGSVDAAMKRFYAAADAIGVGEALKESVAIAQGAKEGGGGSFEPLTVLKEALGEDDELGRSYDAEKYEAFKQHFIDAEENPILYEDATRMLARMKDAGVAFTVMTFGVSQEWQELKLAAAHYDGPVDVISHKDKGSEMKGMRRDDGRFEFPDGRGASTLTVAGSLVLIDDKPESFANLPEGCTGYLLVRPGDSLPSQEGAIPAGVTIISSLDNLDFEDLGDGQYRVTKKTA